MQSPPSHLKANRERDLAPSLQALRASEGLTRLLGAMLTISEARTPAAVAEVVIGQVAGTLGTASGAIFLLSDDETALELAAAYHVPDELLARYQSIPLSALLPATVAVRTGRALLFSGQEDLVAQFPGLIQGRQSHSQASASIPLLSGEHVRGVIAISLREPHVFTEADQAFLMALGRQAAMALDNARLVETLRDIRAQLETNGQARSKHLHQSENSFQSLVDSVQDYAIFMLDAEGHVASWNTGARRIKGYDEAEILGQHFSRFYLPDDVARGVPEKGLATAVRDGRHEYEGWRLRKDGTRFWANVVITPVRAADGGLAGFAKVTRDLTERRRVDDQLRETARRLAEAERVAHLGSWHWDVESNVVTWSDELYRIYGRMPSPEPITYGDYISYCHPDDRHLVQTTISRALETRRPFAFDHRIVRTDGVMRYIQSAGEVMVNAQGRVMAMTGAGQDITERKTIEEELHRSREQLRQLSAGLERAREDERARIAREIHDELGGMLTGLKMDVAQLRRHTADLEPGAAARLDDFSTAIDQTVQTVRRIASELRPAVLDDFGLLAAMEWQLGEFQRRSGLACSWTCATEMVDLPVDAATAVFRVFQESLTNVARHAQASRVDVTVTVQAGGLSLRVADDGRGITNEEKLGMNSLGLVGMRERVEQLGGSVDVQRGSERGTTVTVSVPLTPPKA